MVGTGLSGRSNLDKIGEQLVEIPESRSTYFNQLTNTICRYKSTIITRKPNYIHAPINDAKKYTIPKRQHKTA
jgi:hypothetical protein